MSEQIHTISLARAKETDRKKKAKRARRAMNLIKTYIIRHTGATPLIGKNLNKEVWKGGGGKVPSKIKIVTEVDGDYAKTELFGHKFDEKTKEEIDKERKESKKKKPAMKTEEHHDHDHHEKHDGTEKIPKEIKESHVADQVQEDAKASDVKQEKNEAKSKRHTSGIEDRQPKS